MKRKYSAENNIESQERKMPRMLEENGSDECELFSEKKNISNDVTEIKRLFGYKLTDKKAKSNLIKGAGRKLFEKEFRQKSINLVFCTGSYKTAVMPIIGQWNENRAEGCVDIAENIAIEDIRPGYDLNKKQVDTFISFRYGKNKISVHCYNSTQRLREMATVSSLKII